MYALTPFGLDPLDLDPPWLEPEAGGYLLYRGDGQLVANVDFTEPVGFAQAGDATAYDFSAGLAADTDYTYALRAVSDALVEEEGVLCFCRVRIDGEGALVGQRPNAIAAASAEAAAAGDLTVRFVYSRLGEKAAAAGVQIARVTGGSPNWEAPLATVTLKTRGVTRHDAALGQSYSDGENVQLALRAVTAAGVGGPVTTLPAVACAATGPDHLDYLALEAV